MSNLSKSQKKRLRQQRKQLYPTLTAKQGQGWTRNELNPFMPMSYKNSRGVRGMRNYVKQPWLNGQRDLYQNGLYYNSVNQPSMRRNRRRDQVSINAPVSMGISSINELRSLNGGWTHVCLSVDSKLEVTQTWVVPLTPIFLCERLSLLAKLHGSWTYRNALIRWTPMCSTAQDGMLKIGVSNQCNGFGSSQNGFIYSKVSNMDSVNGSVWSPIQCPIPNPKNRSFPCLPREPDDIPFTGMVVTNSASDLIALGEVSVEMDIKFMEPEINVQYTFSRTYEECESSNAGFKITSANPGFQASKSCAICTWSMVTDIDVGEIMHLPSTTGLNVVTLAPFQYNTEDANYANPADTGSFSVFAITTE